MPRVPTRVTPRIRELSVKAAGEAGEPFFLDVRPDPSAQVLDCFAAVDAKVAASRGSVEHGWRIWEEPGLFAEAEFHAVWRSPSGQLVDVTPAQIPVETVLFKPDPTQVYVGRQVNNVRVALTTNPAIDDLFAAFDAQYEFLNRGSRAEQHGEIHLSKDESAEYALIQRRVLAAQVKLRHETLMKPGRNDPCPCGSGQKYKRCCSA